MPSAQPLAYHRSCQHTRPGHSSSPPLGAPPGKEGAVSSVLVWQAQLSGQAQWPPGMEAPSCSPIWHGRDGKHEQTRVSRAMGRAQNEALWRPLAFMEGGYNTSTKPAPNIPFPRAPQIPVTIPASGSLCQALACQGRKGHKLQDHTQVKQFPAARLLQRGPAPFEHSSAQPSWTMSPGSPWPELGLYTLRGAHRV